MNQNIYSNAFNFSSYLNGSVDLRTGQYSAVIKLATIRSLSSMEATRDISLTFSMVNTIQTGYGLGWNLSNTEYTPNNSTIRLLNGGIYRTESMPPEGYSFRFKDKKLKDIKINKIANDRIEVLYKDGIIETLQRNSPASNYKLFELMFENGEKIRFYYTPNDQLSKITNLTTNKDILTLEYVNNLIQKAHTLIENNKKYTMSFSHQNGQLIQVSVPYDSAISQPQNMPAYHYEYQTFQSNKFNAIRKITTPLGGQEFISYKENGHNFDNNYFIPYVIKWENNPAAGQPSIVKVYSYSQGQNFLGYPFSSGAALPYEDNLYLKVGNYDYWTEEKTIDPNSETIIYESIKTTYNKFHLLKEEMIQRGHAQTIKEIFYNEIPSLLFHEQPANLQTPKKVITKYKLLSSGATREEIAQFETDDYGNTLSQLENSGIKYEYSYYPLTGEGNNCPPDPFNSFVRYLKQEKIIPLNNDGPTKMTSHFYTRLLINDPKGYFIVRNKEIINNSITTEFLYNDLKNDLKLHGRLKSSNMIYNQSSTDTQISYQFNSDVLTETRKVSSHDGNWSESIRQMSHTTNKLFYVQKSDKKEIIRYEYDFLGRLIQESVSSGTSYEAKKTYSYYFAVQGELPKVISTDSLGKKVIIRFDGKGRAVSMSELQNNNIERMVKTLHYNRLDQLTEEMIIDQINSKDLKVTTQYIYNSWGKLSQIKNSDGSINITEENPLENSLTEGILGGNVTLTKFNNYGKIESKTEISSSNEKIQIQSLTYDGLGRCKTDKDVDGHVLEYSYDIFDRITQTISKPAYSSSPARTIKYEYAPHTTSALAKSILIDNKLVGHRNYDGLGRLQNENKGGQQTTQYEYPAGSTLPSATLSPRGFRKKLSYHNEISSLARLEVENQFSNYEYHPISAKLTKIQNSSMTKSIQYDDLQRPIKEIYNFDGKNLEAQLSYSPAGRLLKYHSVLGDTENRFYDSYGRLEKINCNNVNVNCFYDQFSRMNKVIVNDGQFQVETALEYDNFGREKLRSMKKDGILLQSISLSYHNNGQISQKKVTASNGTLISDEKYNYDAYRRLISYQCSGAEFPQDSQGRKIKQQDFTFDSLDNIIRVVSKFTDNSENICTRKFSSENLSQLIQVSFSNPIGQHNLEYDPSGNLIKDHKGRQFQFNSLEQMISISSSGSHLCEYKYDAEGRQICQIATNQDPLYLHYFNNKLLGETQGNIKLNYINGSNNILGRKFNQSGEQQSEINLIDNSGSVRKVLSTQHEEGNTRMYTPYGESPNNTNDSSLPLIKRHNIAFNGTRLDPISQLYHLGNGQRAYSPELMVFVSPDPLSPFGEGGLNSYSYCNGDPINRQDSSGLFWDMFTKVLGLAISLVFFGVAIAAAIPTGGASLSLLAVAGAIGSGLGVVASTLSVAAEGVKMVDEKNGWDRSQHIQNLTIAQFSFGIASSVLSFGSSIKGNTQTALGYKKSYDLQALRDVDLFRSGKMPFSFSMSYAKTVFNSVKMSVPHIETIMRYGPLLSTVSSANYSVYKYTTMGMEIFSNNGSSTSNSSSLSPEATQMSSMNISGISESHMKATNSFSDIIDRNYKFLDELYQQAGNIRSPINQDLYLNSI
ncbi:RHS repeat-associated core domain-containing protein [Silvanigrella aquatica]|uniref:Teneurin-like YD-shell domain-containing protein n=1 Tax=Silvanigrella aquatica TaxID=1915309 RepID=A0A1L4D2D2_9BACT|nr:RHS repeat-associated core domain-containing protein [Silvanigrella aquatica]APJ04352.1 hypothetical protein AXG55_10715 [Silvanigrella aquatica]